MRITCGLATLIAVACSCDAGEPPVNLVFILTDNQGAWTLGCYGNPDMRTPNIDRLARAGTLFTHSFSCNGVCSPTRATYLTGLLPSQHGVHCYLRANEYQIGPTARCTIGEFRSLGEILADAGYVCGLSGKWHLGGNLEPQEGFTYWVTMPHGHTTTFYGAEIVDAGKIRKEPQYLTDFWTEHGVRFIEQNQQRPFFLFLAYNGPYGLGRSLLEPARNRHAAYYADKELASFPREAPHPWLFNNREYINNVQAMRRYAAEISGVDDGVGRIVETLEKHGLDGRTLVVFAGDQGLAGGHSGFWGMGDHTRPLTAYDWTMHVPLIWRHRPGVKAGARPDYLVSNYDFLPSVLDYLGLRSCQPSEPELPGRSYAAVLRGKTTAWDDTVFYEFESTQAIRTRDWKYVHRFPAGPNELYHLSDDPGERRNRVADATCREVSDRLKGQLLAFFDRHADPQYDLRHAGSAKTQRLDRSEVRAK